MNQSKARYLVVVAAVASVVVIVKWAPAAIKFGGFTAAGFIQQLTPMFLVALLIERALEVFLTTWRGPKAADLQRSVDKITEVAQGNAALLPDVQRTQDALTAYKSETQQIAMPVALALGIVVSAIGIRCLGSFVDPKETMVPNQQAAFTVVDVLLTGALVGGGSDVVHSFITALTNFMNSGRST